MTEYIFMSLLKQGFLGLMFSLFLLREFVFLKKPLFIMIATFLRPARGGRLLALS